MAQIKTFKELKVWQKAHGLVLAIYEITQNFPSEEKFGLTSQMRRASISIAGNIVEGFRRKSLKDTLHFYNIAEGSLEELKYQLILSRDLEFVTNDEFNKVNNLEDEVGAMLYSWIKSQK
ncbi:four helix bundle protein [Candidatus Falkowbacteria bacterium]|nr:four helix bundle protein [Candidatus Falkowbacteria bacterium]